MAQVIFDPDEFKALYPEFVNVNNLRLIYFFDKATIILSNEDNSIVQKITLRKILLYLLTAHIALIEGALAQDSLPGPVGRTSNATEGSVSAAFEYTAPDSAQWFLQTAYGAEFWQMTRGIRTMHYYIPNTCGNFYSWQLWQNIS